jgi:hypothetical protein
MTTDEEAKDVERVIKEWEKSSGWEIGRRPRNDGEWLLEIKLRDRIDNPPWLIGHAPEGPEDVENEIRLRSNASSWDIERADRTYRSDLEFGAMRQVNRGDDIRSYVLLAVVAAVVLTPILAMLTDVPPDAFGQYVAPITGIAGTVLGYWFGQRSGNTATTPPTPVVSRAGENSIQPNKPGPPAPN